MSLAVRFTSKGALAVTLCWVAALAVTGATGALLFLAPALLIVIPLLGGRYVGEELIVRLAAKRTRRRRHSAVFAPLRRSPSLATWRPRGTRLIAFSLAERPPPAPLLPQN